MNLYNDSVMIWIFDLQFELSLVCCQFTLVEQSTCYPKLRSSNPAAGGTRSLYYKTYYGINLQFPE